MSRRQDENFKRIQKQWYQKLKDDGFKDIEEESNGRYGDLIKLESSVFRYKRNMASTQVYFSRAFSFLNSYRFKNPVHKYIWELHCHGFTERKIAEHVIYKKSMVHAIISKLAEIIKE